MQSNQSDTGKVRDKRTLEHQKYSKYDKSSFFVEKDSTATGKESVQMFFHNKKYEFQEFTSAKSDDAQASQGGIPVNHSGSSGGIFSKGLFSHSLMVILYSIF